jgi:hypothetical protein
MGWGDTKASVVQHLPAWLLSDLLREDGILIVELKHHTS